MRDDDSSAADRGSECNDLLGQVKQRTTGELLMALAVVRELTGTQKSDLDDTIRAVRALRFEKDAAVAEERERCARICDVTPPYPFRPSIEAAYAIRNEKVANTGRSMQDHAYALGLARGRYEAAAAAAGRVRDTLIVDGTTHEQLRDHIAGRVADVGKPTAWADGLCAT